MAEEDAPPDAEAEAPARPKRRRLERAAQFGLAVVRHRDLLVQALELLRKAQAVTPDQEAAAVAAFETGTHAARAKLVEIVEQLQRANFGEVLVALRDERVSLKSEGKALVDEARRELQDFLDQNRPTLEAIERVSTDLADAGRELAASLKYAGREAADELVQRAKKRLTGIDTAEMERAFLTWSARTISGLEGRFLQALTAFGVLLIIAGLLVVAGQVELLKEAVIAATAAVLLVAGALFLRWSITLRGALRASQAELDRLAAMESRERRTYVMEKWGTRPPAASAAPASSSTAPTLSGRLQTPSESGPASDDAAPPQ